MRAILNSGVFFLLFISQTIFSQATDINLIEVPQEEIVDKKSKEKTEILEGVEINFYINKKEYISGESGYLITEIKNNSTLNYKISVGEVNISNVPLYKAKTFQGLSYSILNNENNKKTFYSINGVSLEDLETKSSKPKYCDKDLRSGATIIYYDFFAVDSKKRRENMTIVEGNKENQELRIVGEKKILLQNSAANKIYKVTAPIKLEFIKQPWNEEKLGEIIRTLEEEAAGDPKSDKAKIATLQLAFIRDERVVPFLSKFLEDKDASIRESAAVALARIEHEDAIKYLREILAQRSKVKEEQLGVSTDNQDKTQSTKRKILENLFKNDDPGVLTCLQVVKDDPNKVVRITALYIASAIYRRNKSEEFLTYIKDATNDSDAAVSTKAKELLEKIDDDSTEMKLLMRERIDPK